MTKKQETKQEKKMIYRSEIYETLDLLITKIHVYQDSIEIQDKSYQINYEFESIDMAISSLRHQIEDVLEET
jgi:hypothetical protein